MDATAPRTDDALHPWQRITIGSGLMLHAPLTLAIDLVPLRAEFAALDAAAGSEGRTLWASDGSWSVLTLIQRTPATADNSQPPGTPTPALAHMPSVRALLARTGWTVVGVNVLRQSPRGRLVWHYEAQAVHLQETRLLVPIHAPAAAFTLLGHERAAYPAGTAWTGDFNFPHQVENPSDQQRIILAIDVVTGPEVRRLLPAALAESAATRRQLAEKACNALLEWRAQSGAAAGAARPN